MPKRMGQRLHVLATDGIIRPGVLYLVTRSKRAIGGTEGPQ
jgi:hypothetical protein